MSAPAKSEYILLFRGTNWHKGLSPEEIQEVVKQMYAWLDRLTAEGWNRMFCQARGLSDGEDQHDTDQARFER